MACLQMSHVFPFYGIIEQAEQVRDEVIHETFIVSQLKDNTILGMLFLVWHRCHINFSKSSVVMARRQLACVNKFGKPLVGSCMISRFSQATIHCRVSCRKIFEL